ncbi:protein serine/threonine kinase [Pelomyxa schiedti]|nr:protein serine/threonine kinase [Pelomyxa schiedti]
MTSAAARAMLPDKLRLKCHLEREIRLVTVPSMTPEQLIVRHLCREFNAEVAVHQYEDHEHDRVTVSPGAPWLDDALMAYNHMVIMSSPGSAVALKIYLRRTSKNLNLDGDDMIIGRSRSGSDPAVYYARQQGNTVKSTVPTSRRSQQYDARTTLIDNEEIGIDNAEEYDNGNVDDPERDYAEREGGDRDRQIRERHREARALKLMGADNGRNSPSPSPTTIKAGSRRSEQLLYSEDGPVPLQGSGKRVPRLLTPEEVKSIRASTRRSTQLTSPEDLQTPSPTPGNRRSTQLIVSEDVRSSQPKRRSGQLIASDHAPILTPLCSENGKQPRKTSMPDVVHPTPLSPSMKPHHAVLADGKRAHTTPPLVSPESGTIIRPNAMSPEIPGVGRTALPRHIYPPYSFHHSQSSSCIDYEADHSSSGSSGSSDYSSGSEDDKTVASPPLLYTLTPPRIDASPYFNTSRHSPINASSQNTLRAPIAASSIVLGNKPTPLPSLLYFNQLHTGTPPTIESIALQVAKNHSATSTPPIVTTQQISQYQPSSSLLANPTPQYETSFKPPTTVEPSLPQTSIPQSSNSTQLPTTTITETGMKPTSVASYQPAVTTRVVTKPHEPLAVDALPMKVKLNIPKCTTTPKHWQIGQPVGRGGFGTVFMGINTDTGEIFAAKQIELDPSDDDRAQKLLQSYDQEIQLMKTLDHPNIVKYLGATIEGLKLNIFMEYVGGGSLSSILSKFGPFSENMVRSYTKQLLQGLSYLHSCNILHRDIKCANILLDTGVGRENVKLSDFGCSRKIADNLAHAQQMSVRGTPFWMAPEVMLGNAVGTPADVWSLACTVVEMVTGKPPWSQQFPEPALAMFPICNSNTPLQIPSHLSPQLQQFLDICLQRDPSLRPDTKTLMKHPFLTMARVAGTLSLSNLEIPISSPSLSSSASFSEGSAVNETTAQDSSAQTTDATKIVANAQGVPRVVPQEIPRFLLEALPPNVIATIMKYLDISDVGKLSLVCHTWEKVLKDDNIWQLVCLDYCNTVIIKHKSWRQLFVSSVTSRQAWAQKEIFTTELKGHDKTILAISCKQGADEKFRVYTASSDKTIKIWDMNKARSAHTLRSHTSAVNGLDFVTADTYPGYVLISCSEDKSIRLWNLKSKKVLHVLDGNHGAVTSISAHTSQLVAGYVDNTLLLWDLQVGTVICSFGLATKPSIPLCTKFHSDVIVTGYNDGFIRIWDPRTPPYQLITTLGGHSKSVTTVDLVSGDNVFVTGSSDCTMRRWELRLMKCNQTFLTQSPVVRLSFDDSKLVSCSDEKIIRIWDPHRGNCIREVKGHTESIQCVYVDSNGIFSGGRDKIARIWQLSQPTRSKRLSFGAKFNLLGKG